MIDEAFVERVRDLPIVNSIGARVELVKRGAEHVGRCPFHDDQDPSLRVSPAKNRWNCSPCGEGGDSIRFIEKIERVSFSEAVMIIAGEAGLYVDAPGTERRSAPPKTVAEYHYADAAGVVRGVKKRWEPAHDGSGKPKSFTWHGPDGAGQRPSPWTPVLYMLPEVISAISEGQTIFVVEGEKCADALAAAGAVATCNEDGAGRWLPEHAAQLAGANVVVLADNDKVGRDHAAAVVASLAGVAKVVATVDLPGEAKAKGDVADWLAAGHALAELDEVVRDALWRGEMARAAADLAAVGLTARKWSRPAGRSLAELCAAPMESVQWVVQGLINVGGIHLLGGEPKGGKTWMETEIAIAVATGTEAFGEYQVRRRGPVLMFYVEDEDRNVRTRARALSTGRRMSFANATGDIRYEARFALDLLSDEDCAGVVASARAMPRPPVLICLDPLRDAHSGEENSNDDMRRVMHRVRAIRDVTGAAVLLVHHMSKPANEKNATGSLFNRLRGASAIRGSYDGGIAIESKSKTETNIKSKVEVELRAGRGAGCFALNLDISDDDRGAAVSAGWARYDRYEDIPGEAEANGGGPDGKRTAILGVLRAERMKDMAANRAVRCWGSPHISQVTGLAERTVRNHLTALMGTGAVGWDDDARGWFCSLPTDD